jgi:hypothetical protein
MAYEQKPETGALFKNERKTTEQHPNMTGSALIDGVAYFVDAWTNTKPDGSKYQSLKFKRKDKQASPVERRMAEASPKSLAEMDDDIPF